MHLTWDYETDSHTHGEDGDGAYGGDWDRNVAITGEIRAASARGGPDDRARA
jgi:hypothetical protein